MGCTEHCFWCGSLCWGQAGHDENEDSTKKHHACHQPRGLIGVGDKNLNHLSSLTCDALTDQWSVYWGEHRESGMNWGKAKMHSDFKNWSFDAHSKTEFNDLMKWFYLNLHNDIAKERGRNPARQVDLEKLGYGKLMSFYHILATIKTKI